jgi:transposase-like protein
VTIRRPRIRGLKERFESVLLPMFQRQSETVKQLLPELYLHGLSMGDFDLALRGLLGDEAPLSATTLARLKEVWREEYQQWKEIDLSGKDPVYLWADGIYVKAGLEKEKAAMLVVLVGWANGTKQFIEVEAGHRESTESWKAVLRNLKKRGLKCPALVMGDGHLGIWGALAEIYPEAKEQRCWNHRIRNVMDKVPKKLQLEAKAKLTMIPQAESRLDAVKLKKDFQKWCLEKRCESAGQLLDHDWDRMVTFYDFPKEHWLHLRTTNAIESPFNRVRLRTNASVRFKKVENATAVIWKTLMIAEKRFRSLNSPELLPIVLSRAMLTRAALSSASILGTP